MENSKQRLTLIATAVILLTSSFSIYAFSNDNVEDSFVVATNGQDRRGDRRDNRDERGDDRRDCRQEEGAGKDKRDCKQDERQDRRDDD